MAAGVPIRSLLILAGAMAMAAFAGAQTVPSATAPTRAFWVGAEYSNFLAGFPAGSSVRLQGLGGFAEYNRTHVIGAEAHLRFLNLQSWNGETEQDYLAGPRYTFLHSNRWRPFAGFQIGMVTMQYPFGIGSRNYFAMAPEGGVEYKFARKWMLRGSYDYQFLMNSPDFSNEPQYGIRPNGFHAGIAYRLF